MWAIIIPGVHFISANGVEIPLVSIKRFYHTVHSERFSVATSWTYWTIEFVHFFQTLAITKLGTNVVSFFKGC